MSIFASKEYFTILDFYGTRKAERSKCFLMNHINEGLLILMENNRTLVEMKAYCIHPIVQNDENIDVSWSEAYELAIEYKNIANSYLCRKNTDHLKTWEQLIDYIEPMSIYCAYMLLADKIQNQKDFLLYHYGTHNRSKELDQYFKNWICYLNYIIKEKYEIR